MLKNSLFSPLYSAPFFCFSIFLSFCFSAAPLFLFLFLFPGQPPLFFLSFLPAFFFFSLGVLPFIFQPKILFFSPNVFQPKMFLLQPKTFFSSAQNVFFFQFSHSYLIIFYALFFFCSALFFFFFFQRLLFSFL